MKCGHCKEQHPTVNDVINCYHGGGEVKVVERTPVPERVRIGMTANQETFIRALLEQTGMTEDRLFKPMDKMSVADASNAITTLQQMKREMPRSESAAGNLPGNVEGTHVPQGTYTVVFPDEGRITLRFRAPKNGKWKDKQLVEYLYGPDNTSHYRRCANETTDGYRIWNQFKEDGRIAEGIKFLAGAKDSDRAEAGLTYAMESSNCYRCGRKLTVPVSIHRGLGPECARKVA